MNTSVPLALALAAALAGCAAGPAPPAPGMLIDAARLQAMAQPGTATRAGIAAAFGPTRSIAFDSGKEVWLYLVAAGAGAAPGARFTEVVLLFDRNGVLRKVRQRPPHPYDRQDKS